MDILQRLTKVKKRYILYRQWYIHLQQEGIRMYGKDQSDLAWYAKYNMLNCAIWAFHNSGTHETNGSYRIW